MKTNTSPVYYNTFYTRDGKFYETEIALNKQDSLSKYTEHRKKVLVDYYGFGCCLQGELLVDNNRIVKLEDMEVDIECPEWLQPQLQEL